MLILLLLLLLLLPLLVLLLLFRCSCCLFAPLPPPINSIALLLLRITCCSPISCYCSCCCSPTSAQELCSCCPAPPLALLGPPPQLAMSSANSFLSMTVIAGLAAARARSIRYMKVRVWCSVLGLALGAVSYYYLQCFPKVMFCKSSQPGFQPLSCFLRARVRWPVPVFGPLAWLNIFVRNLSRNNANMLTS